MRIMNQHVLEVSRGERFEFGKNWTSFLGVLDEQRIAQAVQSLRDMLGVDDLRGRSFLDIGSGSGLFSLAARRLGASVFSFDYDPQSVECTLELRRRYFPDDPQWRVAAGSVLDAAYMAGLPRFDVVYSWGVLHHTGAMWAALEAAVARVAPGGQLFIAIYNDQGAWSRRWHALKRIYNRLPAPLKKPYGALVMGGRESKRFLGAVLRGRYAAYARGIRNYSATSRRGMNYRHDLIDWIGGYPFEVAKPEQIFDFHRLRGFELQRLSTCAGGIGCNEYVFKRRE
jgi:2-polyprenyl-6-hydroxyphenyl methylase/3-demethylubiquinone-9 3-methyltransferase